MSMFAIIVNLTNVLEIAITLFGIWKNKMFDFNSHQWYGMVWYGMVWYGMVWYGMVWYGMVWYGMVYLFFRDSTK